MKIGIYLAYAPHFKISMKNEGLGRYLANLIRILHNNGCKVCIACPTWMIEPVKELCDEYNFPVESIEFVTPSAEPVLWRLLKKRHSKEHKPRVSLKSRIFQASYSTAENLLTLLTIIKSDVLAFLLGIGIAVLGVISLPFVALYYVLRLLWKLVCLICKLFKIDISSKSGLKQSVMNKIPGLNSIIQNLHSNHVGAKTAEKIRLDAVKSIFKRIKAMKAPADIWYSPMAYWPEFSDIPGIGVACFPDITPAWFPVDFSNMGMLPAVENVRETVNHCKYFIVYSEYQKNSILSANLGIGRENIKSIPLAVNDTLHDIDARKAFGKYFSNSEKRYARNLLNGSLFSHAPKITQDYLFSSFNSFSFKDIKYIFYSSQCRPNKNILTLVKAYEYLLREKEITFKLVLTCCPEHVPVVNEYIISHRLQYDILAFHMVSNQQLSALYACAELVVNPTLFEGGFPMTFAEGMAVGTPSVMGTIPQVTDVTDRYDFDDCLFDPFDYKDMAEKILYGVQHREEIYKKQLPLYQSLVASTEEEYGKEYIDAFKYFIELDKEEKSKRNTDGDMSDNDDADDAVICLSK